MQRLSTLSVYIGFATISVLVIRPTSALTVSDWIFVLAFAAVLVATIAGKGTDQLWLSPAFAAGVTLLLLGAVVSMPRTIDPVGSLSVIARFAWITLAWFAIAPVALRTRLQVQRAILLWVASVAISGFVAAVQLGTGQLIFPGSITVYGRMTGLAQHFTDLGGMSAIALVPALAIVDWPWSRAVQVGAAAVPAVLVAAGLLLSGSVDGFLSAGVALLLWIALGGLGRRGLLALAILGLGGVLLAGTASELGLALPTARIGAVLAAPTDPGATLSSRIQTYEVALERIAEDPIVGQGFDTVGSTTATGEVVHNIFLAVWYEGGGLAMLGILLTVAGVLRVAWLARVRGRLQKNHSVSSALVASIAAGLVFSLGNPMLFQRYLWAPVFLAIALTQIHRESDRGPVAQI